ncbi:MAG: flagellar biosynthesis anti-sigma factor FlgM [Pirellulales bacterium]
MALSIHGPIGVHGPQAITAPHTQRVNSPASSSSAGVSFRDDVQISDTAQLISRIHDLPEIRADRVNQIRSALANGTYLSDDKLDVALDRLLAEIA